MKNKPNLITLLLTIVFSFTVTSVVRAECIVEIRPSDAIVFPGEQLTLTAETTCEEGEASPPSYTWEISQMGCTGGSIDPDTGTYTSGAEDGPCQDTIMVTDTANRRITDTANVAVGIFDPSLTISGPATLGPPCPASGTYTAEMTLDGATIIPGTYTWELDGISAGTGNTFEVTCTEDGTKTLLVTDTANGNITASITIECVCYSDDFNIYASITGCGTPFIPWFGVVEIEGTPLIVFGLTNIVRYDSPLVLKTPKLLNRGDNKITQFVILLPSILFPEWDYPATVKVSVDGPSDTIEIPACGQ